MPAQYAKFSFSLADVTCFAETDETDETFLTKSRIWQDTLSLPRSAQLQCIAVAFSLLGSESVTTSSLWPVSLGQIDAMRVWRVCFLALLCSAGYEYVGVHVYACVQ